MPALESKVPTSESDAIIGEPTLRPEWAELSTEEQDDVLCGLSQGCCSYDGVERQREVSRHRLDRKTTLLLMVCNPDAYNQESLAWTVSDGREPTPARIEPFPAGVDLEGFLGRPGVGQVTSFTSPWLLGGLLHSRFCHRRICDTGSQSEIEWTGEAFRLRRLRNRDDDCCAEIPGAQVWPIVWPASEVCGYRWSVTTNGPVLVSIMPRGERETRVTEVTGHCEVTADGAVLNCDDNNLPVTSIGNNWVIWKRTGTLAEPGTPTVLRRIHRGCDMHADR